ncbi:hypothetical protein [Asanoa siamensis]|uniref:Glucose-6-phosphate dehydrogenase C-terminal domain-containing protein n=1 Tax=Asanoa siamensis TaxID=926357 RepID=A0ABQ4D408_9ACTN|nr:hypothetical protein [Asanoa siamensis]GIF78274.1 hypothetical protein Asi02nite_77920 [Asanoa siamensis]
MQLLCLTVIEPRSSVGDRDLRDRKVDVLRSIRPLTLEQAVNRTRRPLHRRPDR